MESSQEPFGVSRNHKKMGWEAAAGHVRAQPSHVTPSGFEAMRVLMRFLQPKKNVGSSLVIFGGSKSHMKMQSALTWPMDQW